MTNNEKNAVLVLQIARDIKSTETTIGNETVNTLYNLINRQKAEIERLKFENLALSQKRITMFERIGIVDNARKKSIREFLDKLKERAHNLPEYDEGGWECRISVVEVEDIDRLVKEMTEDNNT